MRKHTLVADISSVHEIKKKIVDIEGKEQLRGVYEVSQ
jgi:hypothetical protein